MRIRSPACPPRRRADALEPEFRQLCDANPRVGYVVIRNLAQDLAYKLRSSNLLLRGNIRWQRGELGKS